jgi:hypothetical protein
MSIVFNELTPFAIQKGIKGSYSIMTIVSNWNEGVFKGGAYAQE